MEEKHPPIPPPFSAGSEAGSWNKFLEEGVRDKLSRKSVSSLSRGSSSASPSSIWSLHDDDSWHKSRTRPDPPLHRRRSRRGHKSISSAQFERGNVSCKTKAEEEKTDQAQDFRTEDKRKKQAFPKNRTQPEHLLDPALSSPAFNRNVRSSWEPSHEMSDGQSFLPRPSPAKRQSLKRVSEHGSTRYPKMISFFNTSTNSPFSAGSEAGSWNKTAVSSQDVKEELNEDENELYSTKKVIPIFEKQRTADEKFSEKGFHVKPPSTSCSSLPPNSSSASLASFRSLYDYDSWYKSKVRPELLLPSPPPQQTKPLSHPALSSAASNRNVRSSWEPSHELSEGGHFLPYRSSTKRGSVQRASQHGSTTYPNYPFLFYPSIPFTFSAGHDAGRWKKTGDAPQEVKDEMNEDTNESLYKNLTRQTSISEKQTVDEKFLEEGVRDKLSRKSVSSLSRGSSSASPSSIWSLHDDDSWHKSKTRPDPPLHRRRSRRGHKSIISAQFERGNVSCKTKAEEEKTDQAQDFRTEDKRKKQAFPKNRTQPEHLLDPALSSPAFNRNVRSPWEPSHEMSDGQSFLPRPSPAKRQSLKRVSEHGSTRYPKMISFFNTSTNSPFSAGSEAGSWNKTADSPQDVKEELNEDENELYSTKKVIPIFEKQRTADEKFSEKGFHVKPPSTSCSSLPPNSSSASLASFRSLYDYDSWYKSKIRPELLLPSPPPQQTKPLSHPALSSAASNRNVRSSWEPSHELSEGGHFLPYRSSTKRGSVQRASQHGSTTYPNYPFLFYPSIPFTFSAGHDAGRWKKTGDAPQEVKDEMNEDTNESLYKNLTRQTSISEKQTVDEKFLEEGVRDKLSRKSVSSLSRGSSSASPSSIWSLHDDDSWHKSRTRPDPPLHRRRSRRGHKSISSAQFERGNVSCKTKAEEEKTDQAQDFRTEDKRKKQAFPKNRTQPEHLLDPALSSPAFNRNVRSPWEPSHEMSDGQSFLPRPSPAKRQSLKRVSEHGSTIYPKMISFFNTSTNSPFSAGSEAGSWNKTADSPQDVKEELNEDENELYSTKKVIPIFEKQRTADEKFSEKGFHVKPPSTSCSSLPPNSSSASLASFRSLYDYDSWYKSKIRPELLLPSPPPQQTKPLSHPALSSAASNRNVRSSWEPSHELSEGGHFLPYRSSTKRGSVQRASQHGSTTYPNYPFLFYPSIPFTFSAGHDAGRWKKTGDAPQEVKDEMNEDTNESLYKNLTRQTSISEKQTVDEKFLEEGVRDKLSRKSVSSLSRGSSSASPSSIWSLHDDDSWHKSRTRPDPPLHRRRSRRGHKSISSAQFERGNVSCKTKAEEEKTDQAQDFRTEDKRKKQAFPKNRTQPEHLLDPALSSPASNRNVRSSWEPSHEMSDGQSFLPRPSPAKRQSLKRVSEHGSTRYPKMISFFNTSTNSPFSAGSEAGSWNKTADSPQDVKEELNEDENELYSTKKVIPIFEKQRTADEKFSEKGFHVKPPSTSCSSLPPNSSSASLASFRSLHDDDSWHKSKTRPDPPLHRRRSRRGHKSISLAQFEPSNVSSKTKAEEEKTDQVLSSATVQCDPDIELSALPVPPQPYNDPSWRKLSTTVPQSVAIIPSVAGAPCPENNAGVLRDCSSDEKQREDAFLDEVTPPFVCFIPQETLLSKPQKRMSRRQSFRRNKKPKIIDSTDYMLHQHPAGTLTETGMIKNLPSAFDATSGVCEDNIREMEPTVTTGPSTLQLSTSDDDSDSDTFATVLTYAQSKTSTVAGPPCPQGRSTDFYKLFDDVESCFPSTPSQGSDQIADLLNKEDIYYYDEIYEDLDEVWESIAPTVAGPPCPQGRSTVLQDSTVCTEGSGLQDVFELLSVQSESESGGHSDVLVEMEAAVPAVKSSVTSTLPTHSQLQTCSSDPGGTKRGSSCLCRSHSVPSLSQITSAENKTFTRSNSSPDMLLKNSCEEFTPEITADEEHESFRFQCSCPGLYQCRVTGLLFHMEGEGDVVYRIVPWNRRLLVQHHKQPAGPLFDVKCLQHSVCQLHLPHCEIRSTGGCDFLSVAHVNDEGIEFIRPHKITETHVIINITGFSGFGNVKDEDSPPDPVRALVLLFYRPPADPDLGSLLNVLLLPGNVVIRDVVRSRKELVGDEIYIETPPDCKLHPNQEYTLSTCPEDDSVLVQPRKAEFYSDNCDNYVPSFQVKLKTILIDIKLLLRDTKTSNVVWEREVCLSSTAVKRSGGRSARNLPPEKTLFVIRSSFVDRISGPVLKRLVDKLLKKKVLTDSERESAEEMQNTRDKARFVIDTVRRKGEAASSAMIECLYKIDCVLFKSLGLK